MTKLLTPADVAEVMSVSKATARAYIRQMVHIESPLRTTEEAFREWLNSKATEPGEVFKIKRREV